MPKKSLPVPPKHCCPVDSIEVVPEKCAQPESDSIRLVQKNDILNRESGSPPSSYLPPVDESEKLTTELMVSSENFTNNCDNHCGLLTNTVQIIPETRAVSKSNCDVLLYHKQSNFCSCKSVKTKDSDLSVSGLTGEAVFVDSLSSDFISKTHGESTKESNELRQQLDVISLQLSNAQNRIEQLLAEKRSWLEQNTYYNHANNAPTGVGELRGRWLQAKNQAETYKKEKEAMVMKYAQSEKRRLAAESRIQELERRMNKYIDGPATSLSSIGSPSNPSLSDIGSESTTTFPAELQSRLTQTEKALNTTREQLEILRKGQASAETRVSSLNARLNEAQQALKLEQRKSSSLSDTINRLNRSLETASKQAKEAERLREREAERLCAEVSHRETQERIKRVLAENDELRERLNKEHLLRTQLNESEKRVTELTAENQELMELREEIEAGKRREDQLSEYTRRLAERNSNLQSEHLITLQRLDEVTQKLTELERVNEQFTCELAASKQQLVERTQQLEDQLIEAQSQVDELHRVKSELSEKLNREHEQAQLTHRRDAARIRDLVRQLTRAMHRGGSASGEGNENYEASTSPLQTEGEPLEGDSGSKLDVESRTSSLHSIDLSVATTITPMSSICNKSLVLGNPLLITGDSAPHDKQSPTTCDARSNVGPAEPDQAAVLNKLDRLQRVQAKLTDKVEFFQEHCYQLTEELNKKNRLIQHLLVLTDKHSGAVSPNIVDTHKQIIARTGGLMASLYTGRSNSSTLPDRDTCLEISQKLQRVLEDTLFKNLTLKENLGTLGLEISSLNTLIGDIRARLCNSCRASTDGLQLIHQTSFSQPAGTAQPMRMNPEPPTFDKGGVSA